MAPRAATTPTRGRGRPKRDAAAPAPTAVADVAQKRGRAPKAVALAEPEPEPESAPQPKKRGRAAKAPVEEAPVEDEEVAIEGPKARGGRGRPRKEPVVEDAPAPAKRGGRPRKQELAVEDAPATPAKRKGRPPKNAVDLDRVVGSPRVSKRTSPRAKTATRKAPAAAAPAPRVDPRVRSKLRTRVAPAEKKAPVVKAPKPKKRTGRPPKKEVAAAPTKKSAQHKTKDARVSKPAAKPRKRRGITEIEVPDKYAMQVKEYLQGLMDADVDAAAAEAPSASLDDEPEAVSVQEKEDIVVNESNGVNGQEISDEVETSEQPLDELADEMDEDVDVGAQELSANDADGLMKPIDYDQDDLAVEDATEEVVTVRDVEMEVEFGEPSDESQGPEQAAASGEVQIQQEITEEVYVEEQPGDEPDSLFDDDLDDGSSLAPVTAQTNVAVAQMLPPTFG